MRKDPKETTQTTDWQILCNQLGARTAAEFSHIEGPTYPTRVEGIDQLLGGGLPCQTLSEVVSGQHSCGSSLLLHRLLDSTRERAAYAALVDASDRFAPDQVTQESSLEHLYWVRCRSTEEALRVSDILSNDRNFALLLIDLRGADLRTLHSVPGNRWYRLQRAMRKNGGTSVALTSKPSDRIASATRLPEITAPSIEALIAWSPQTQTSPALTKP